MWNVISLPFGFMGLGLAMVYLAWLALGEYRELFRRNPRLVMSVDVFATVAEIGGPGYLASLLAIVGAWFLVIGAYLGAWMIFAMVGDWFR